MEKTLLVILLFSIGFSFTVIGQNGALYQDWYLTSYQANGETYNISEIDPHIAPNLNMEQNLDFSGIAACNNYLGSFIYDSTNDFLILDNFDATLSLCDYQSHSIFETRYFSILNDGTFSYNIIYNTDDEFLELVSDSGNILTYSNAPLVFSINEAFFSTISIYPNPVLNTLHITFENNNIERLNIYSISGQIVLKQHTNNNTIDVSNLSKGIYFIEIDTTEGKTIKKFVKN